MAEPPSLKVSGDRPSARDEPARRSRTMPPRHPQLEPDPHSASLGEMPPDPARPDSAPFGRPGLFARAAPFALVAIAAEASLALPPGTHAWTEVAVSLVLLALVPLAILLPWDRLPGWMPVLVPLAVRRLGTGPDPSRGHHLRGGHRGADPAHLDRPVPPPLGVGLRPDRDRGGGSRRLGGPVGSGRGDRPPGAAVGRARRVARGGGPRATGADPAVAGGERPAAGAHRRAHGRPGQGPSRRRPAEQRRAADLRGRAEAAGRAVLGRAGGGAAAGGIVGDRSGRRDPPAPAGDLRPGAPAGPGQPAAAGAATVRGPVAGARDHLRRAGGRRPAPGGSGATGGDAAGRPQRDRAAGHPDIFGVSRPARTCGSSSSAPTRAADSSATTSRPGLFPAARPGRPGRASPSRSSRWQAGPSSPGVSRAGPARPCRRPPPDASRPADPADGRKSLRWAANDPGPRPAWS